MNAPLEEIPEHLREYITEQDSSLYTPIDQAVWRYVMRVSKAFFGKHGHPLYLQGLTATGISTDQIPTVAQMDQALRKLGWRAVAINGFIPPAIFLEFQSLRILAIACDIRKLENLGYTPSPDIIHEAAGHVPIVADPAYRTYLEAYGEVARNAIITKYDVELYEAIFELSEIKEDPNSTPVQIEASQKKFELIASQEKEPSEAALLTRMAWWTTEYGLIEKNGVPLIYGAGLLSSVSESFNCLKDRVKKIPFSLEASIKTSYDITKPQPQLFVAKSFEELTQALDQFANSMAFRKGGVFGLKRAESAQNTTTAVLDNGIQVSGIMSDIVVSDTDEEAGFFVSGTKQISFHDEAYEELSHHHLGTKVFFPLFEKNVINASPVDIQRKLHGSGLHAKNGLRVQGRFKKEVLAGKLGKILVLEKVKITNVDGKIIYEERVKDYPLLLASKVSSVFGGAADRKNFVMKNQSMSKKKVKSHQSNLTPENLKLSFLYQRVRDYRETNENNLKSLEVLLNDLNQNFPQDWLLRLELLEIFQKQKTDSVLIADQNPNQRDMIVRGMELV